jgi:hypothetical protein
MSDKTDTETDPAKAPEGDIAVSSIDQRKAKDAEAAENARKQLFAALAAYEEAIREQASFLGWDQGFSVGWKAATKYFQEEAEKAREAMKSAPLAAQRTASLSAHNLFLPFGVDDGVAPSSGARVIVERYIKANPGLRGVDIAKALSSSLPERTVRTALHRLKVAGRIKTVDGRWYAGEAAPPDPQPQAKENDNAAP